MSDDTIKNLKRVPWSIKLDASPTGGLSSGRQYFPGETDFSKSRNTKGRFMNIKFPPGVNVDEVKARAELARKRLDAFFGGAEGGDWVDLQDLVNKLEALCDEREKEIRDQPPKE